MSRLSTSVGSPNAPAEATASPARRSLMIYLILLAYLVVVKVVLDVAEVGAALPAQATLFSWPMIAFLAVAGSVAVWIGPRAGLPDLGTAAGAWRGWLPASAGAGAALGAAALAFSVMTGSARMMADAAGVESINVPFPASILFYSGGAVVVESLFRLIAITVPVWLIGTVLLRGRGQAIVFWAVALVTSTLESSDQMGFVAGHPEVMLAIGAAMYAINVVEAYLFRRNGFLAPLGFRIAFYMVWHVIGGLLGL